MKSFIPVPKPTRDTTDYQAKAIVVSGKIATLSGRCAIKGCSHTRIGGWDIVPHHIVHRKYGNTCALAENLFPCCVPCHSRIHHYEQDFKSQFNDMYPGLLNSLQQQARQIFKGDWADVYETLLITYKCLLEEKAYREAHED